MTMIDMLILMVEILNISYVSTRKMATFKLAERYPRLDAVATTEETSATRCIASTHWNYAKIYLATGLLNALGVVPSN